MILKNNIEDEEYRSLIVLVEAKDLGSPQPLASVVPVYVTVADVNDNQPIFDETHYRYIFSQSSYWQYRRYIEVKLKLDSWPQSDEYFRHIRQKWSPLNEKKDNNNINNKNKCKFTAKDFIRPDGGVLGFPPLISKDFLCLNSAVTSEGTPVGHSVIKVRATDEDKGTNADRKSVV